MKKKPKQKLIFYRMASLSLTTAKRCVTGRNFGIYRAAESAAVNPGGSDFMYTCRISDLLALNQSSFSQFSRIKSSPASDSDAEYQVCNN